MPKAQMSLEYMVKMMIVLVVVVVVVGLIIKFSSDLKLTIKKLFGEEKKDFNFPEIIEKNSFTPGEVSVYMESCYSKMTSIPESQQKDVICYLLKSKEGFIFGKGNIQIPKDLTGKVEFCPSTPSSDCIKDKLTITIKFIDPENKIQVSD